MLFRSMLRDAKGPHDVRLAASPLADQLSSKHPKSATVTLSVLEHRLDAAEIDPMAIISYNADRMADARGTVRDERQ